MDLALFDRHTSELLQEYGSNHRFEEQLFYPTREQLLDLSVRAATLLGSLPADPPDAVAGVLLGQFREQLETLLARLADDHAYPHRYIQGASFLVTQLLDRDPREPERRAEVLRRRLIQIRPMLEAVLELLAACGDDRRAMAAEALRQGAALLDRLAPHARQQWAGAVRPVQLQNLDSAFAAAAAAHREALDRLRALPAAAVPRQGLPYAELLPRVFGVTVAELDERAEHDVEQIQAELARLAREIRPGATAAELLAAVPACAGPDAMLAELGERVAHCRAETRRILPLPEGEECGVELVPDYLQENFAFGGYTGPNLWAGGRRGTVYTNGRIHTQMNRLWLENLALHECYPGHHTHFVWAGARPMPESFRQHALYSRATLGIEGAAHRSESRYGHFFRDPLFPLFATWRNLHTAVRLLVDLALNHRDAGLEQAVDLYGRHAGLEPAVARSQAMLQTKMRGIMVGYWTGFRHLTRIQLESGLDDTEFTRLIFTHGFISPATVARLAALPPAERARVFAAWE